ncbi:glycosyltransferase involved in cell wall biosynthesis [Sphingomonas naasensis]|uniref:glycosyltransferase n=1 Tax=Sphingomonas naasensis TaxID=1344951 RepID=UPI00141BB9BA|nr:glycosyltransferase [Sphingomonas naasensis]NIJ19303.1 glycosyltransferase involved in cell wall biosynthesis [Sphingomonas naasensis]
MLVNESLGGGGAERQLAQVANGFAADGERVWLASWASAEVPDRYVLSPLVTRVHLRKREPGGGKVAWGLALAASWLRALRLIWRLNPDVIISFSEVSNILVMHVARLTGHPVVASIRTNPEEMFALKPHWRRLALAAYRRAAAIVVQTQGVAEWCLAQCGTRATIIPNMIRTPLPDPLPMTDRLPLITCVGSFFEYKGHAVLIRAFAAVHRQNPHWRLALLGDGPERDHLEALTLDLGLEGAVDFLGFTEDVDAILARSSIFTLASRFEGFPNALIEAMAMGCAAISTDCDYGPGEIITQGENGILVPVNDAEALAAALETLIADDALRARLAMRALAVRTRLSADVVRQDWRALTDSIASASGR